MENSPPSPSSPKKSREKRAKLERGPTLMPHPTSAAMKLPAFFEEDRLAGDAALERLLPQQSARPASIHQAMRYNGFAGGKRIRPILCLETPRIFSPDVPRRPLPASACEMFANTS